MSGKVCTIEDQAVFAVSGWNRVGVADDIFGIYSGKKWEARTREDERQ